MIFITCEEIPPFLISPYQKMLHPDLVARSVRGGRHSYNFFSVSSVRLLKCSPKCSPHQWTVTFSTWTFCFWNEIDFLRLSWGAGSPSGHQLESAESLMQTPPCLASVGYILKRKNNNNKVWTYCDVTVFKTAHYNLCAQTSSSKACLAQTSLEVFLLESPSGPMLHAPEWPHTCVLRGEFDSCEQLNSTEGHK